MLWIAATVIAAQEPPQRPVAATRQAQAMVRILRPAIVAFSTGSVTGEDSAELRQSAVRLPDGSRRSVKLIEFQ